MSDVESSAGFVAVGFAVGGIFLSVLTFMVVAVGPVKVLPESTAQATECRAIEWPTCIAKACPNGILVNGPDLVSCKPPASAPCPPPRDAGAP
jgi:hypothetical protein